MRIVYDTYASPIGLIWVVVDDTGVRRIILREDEWQDYISEHGKIQNDKQTCRGAVRQLEDYFRGRIKAFDLPLSIEGTEFCKSVWKELQQIPYGETRSYMEVAEAIGNPKACRAIGQANKKNPLPIIIPCHRVIGADGALTGYMGSYTDIKRNLLDLEKSHTD